MEPRTFATPDRLKLELRIPDGTIEIAAAETGETSLEVTGLKSPDDLEVEFSPASAGGHRLRIELRRNRLRGWRRGEEIHVALTVTHRTDVEVATGSGGLRISGAVDSLAFRSGSGDLVFGEVRGLVEAKLASGDLRGDSVEGNLSVHGASSDVRIEHVGGSARVRTASGDTRIGRAGGSLDIGSVSGDVSIRTACAGVIGIRTVSGDIEVGVAPGARAWLDLCSRSGETVSDLAPAPEGPGATIEIRASSVSGDIRVAHGERDVVAAP